LLLAKKGKVALYLARMFFSMSWFESGSCEPNWLQGNARTCE
jgi:hypothetical protein